MKKRILSALLALCMVLTLLPAETLAAELQELTGEQQDAAFDPGALEPGGEEPEELGLDEEVLTGDKLSTEEDSAGDELRAEDTSIGDELGTEKVSTGDESDIMPYADTTGTVDYTIENGAVLTFDLSTGTITKCMPNNAKVIVIPKQLGGVPVTVIGNSAFFPVSD